jgi:hypothetical protein
MLSLPLPSRWPKWLREFWFGDIIPLDESKLEAKWGAKQSNQSHALEVLRRERAKVADDLKTATGNVNTAITALAIVIALAGSGLTASVSPRGWERSAAIYLVGATIVILIWSYMPRTREAWLHLRGKLSEREDCDTPKAEYIQLKQDTYLDQRRLWRAHCYQGAALHLCALIVALGCWVLAHH